MVTDSTAIGPQSLLSRKSNIVTEIVFVRAVNSRIVAESSRMLPMKMNIHVAITPLRTSGVIATWMFIFIGSIRELSATILLFTARTKTISVTMFDLRESNDWGPIAVLSITMLLITFAMIL